MKRKKVLPLLLAMTMVASGTTPLVFAESKQIQESNYFSEIQVLETMMTNNASFNEVMEQFLSNEAAYYYLLENINEYVLRAFMEYLTEEETYQFLLHSKYAYANEVVHAKREDVEKLLNYADLYAAIPPQELTEETKEESEQKVNEQLKATVEDKQEYTTYPEYIQNKTKLDVENLFAELDAYADEKDSKAFRSYLEQILEMNDSSEKEELKEERIPEQKETDKESKEEEIKEKASEKNNETTERKGNVVERSVKRRLETKKFEVLAYVEGDMEVTALTWTENNGKDDLKSYPMEKGFFEADGQTYNRRAVIDATDHNNEAGLYETEFQVIKDKRSMKLASDMESESTISSGEPYALGDCRIGTSYFLDLHDAMGACYNGATIYVRANITTTPISNINGNDQAVGYSILPEGGNWTIQLAYGNHELLFYDLESRKDPNLNFTFGGNNGYTLTINGNGNSGYGLLSFWSGNVTLNKGLILQNMNAAGINHGKGGYIHLNGAIIRNNETGVYSDESDVRFTSGEVYNNKLYGVAVNGLLEMTGGKIYNNGTEGLRMWHPTDNGSFISNGEIYGNDTGVLIGSDTTLTINSGNIYNNFPSENKIDAGILNSKGTLILNDGKIYGNTSKEGWGNGIYNAGNLYMRKNAAVDLNNDIYLPDSRYITVDGALASPLEKVGRITPANYELGRKLVEVSYDDKKASDEFFNADLSGRFVLTPKDEFVIRPGDYIAE